MFVCDRCGKAITRAYSEHWVIDLWMDKEGKIEPVGIDLCEECEKSLDKWFKEIKGDIYIRTIKDLDDELEEE